MTEGISGADRGGEKKFSEGGHAVLKTGRGRLLGLASNQEIKRNSLDHSKQKKN